MKKTKIYLSLCLLLVGGFTLTSCSKNTTSTIMPLGTEDYNDINEVIPNTAFWTAFGHVQNGPFPPDIKGNYVMSPKQRVTCSSNITNWPIITEPLNVYFSFSAQHNSLVAVELNEDTNTTIDTAFVKGNGDTGEFLAYFVEEKEIDSFQYGNNIYILRTRQGVAMKGKVTQAGIVDFRYGTIVLAAESEPAGAPLQEVGSYFIYKDGDNLAARN